MTKLATIMNEYFKTEGYAVDELIVDAEMALDNDELVRELVKFIYHLDEVLV